MVSTFLQTGPTRYGTMTWPRVDRTIGLSLGVYGEFGESENRVIARYLKSGDWAVDIGANVGTTLLPMAKCVGPNGYVVGFEPQPLIAQCLQSNLTMNDILHARIISAACGKNTGIAYVPPLDYRAASNYGAVALTEDGLPVPMISLDDLKLSRCNLIKIDVEGHEWDVIQGAEQTLIRHRPILYMEAKQIPGTQSVLAWLMQNGWKCYWHFAHFFTPYNFLGNPNNLFGGSGDMNFIAFPQEVHNQPVDMPLISSPEENWKDIYGDYYKDRLIPGMVPDPVK